MEYQELHHEMSLETTYPSGAQEWFCPFCARRVILDLEPTLSYLVLDEGDINVTHTGDTGDLRVGPLQTQNDGEPDIPDELRAALEEILKNVDLDW